MTAQPIYTAIDLIVASLSAALGSNAHWERNDSADPARPYLIFQSQDSGGKLWEYVDSIGWRGLITVRAIADYWDDAKAALFPAYAAMKNLTAPGGYTIKAVYDRPITIPPDGTARHAAAQWELFIERT